MPIFVVQKHKATHLHYDFRIEKDGVLKSWAIPKEPLGKHFKRLAIEVGDHELDYANFEGEIEEGYGKGTVEIWDSGDVEIKNWGGDKIEFELNGKKMKGKFILIHPKKFKENEWLLIK